MASSRGQPQVNLERKPPALGACKAQGNERDKSRAKNAKRQAARTLAVGMQRRAQIHPDEQQGQGFAAGPALVQALEHLEKLLGVERHQATEKGDVTLDNFDGINP